MKRVLLVNALLFVVLLFSVQGCAMGAKDSGMKVITGTVRVVGNEPFTHVVLTLGENPDTATKDQEYLIVGPLEKELRSRYQWKRLTLEGSLCSSPTPEFSQCFNPSRILDKDGGPREQ